MKILKSHISLRPGWCVALTILLTISPCVGRGAMTLTLEQCRELALANNTAIRSAGYRLQQAHETRREAFTKYFPEVSAQGMAFRANTNMAEIGLLDILTISFLRKGHLAGVQFVQPIFMGGQIVNGNKLASVGEAVAELQRQQSRRDVVVTVDKYFWQIAALEARQHTLQSATRMVDSLLITVQAALDAGVTTLNDVLEVKLKRRELLSDSVDLDNGIRLCRMVLAQYIGADTLEIITVYPAFDHAPEIPVEDYRDPSQALLQMPQYQMLAQGVKAASLERSMAIGKYLPMVAGGGGYFHQSMLGASHGFWAGYVGISVPISGWWGGSHDIKRKKLDEALARTRLEDDSQLLQISIRSAWDDLTAAQRRAALAQEAIGQAEENLHIYEAFYEAGTTTITDLLGAQALHRQAQDALTEACASYQVALTSYRVATSQLDL